MIVFQNSGEIDLLTVTTFGCSVKESKNPIGMFGTGLKYALGVLLRTGHKVFIQSGASEVEVTAKQNSIRGKDFGFVMIGDVRAGFTTELGKLWEPWMAYRELHCNAVDEPDGQIYHDDCHPPAEAGKTRIIVFGESLEKVHETRGDFILQSQPAFKIGSIEVHSRPSSAFFYRGIQVMTFAKPSLYTYNQTDPVELTEDRTVKQPEMVAYALSREILAHANKAMLETVLCASTDNIESFFDYHGWSSVEPGPDFLPTVADLQRSSLNKINPTALRLWRDKSQGFLDPRRVRASKVQLATLERAIAFCEKMGFMLRGEYPIFIVETLGDNGALAMADIRGKQIFLAERLFQSAGTKGVASALIEEYAHLKYGYADCTRQMQNFLFEKLITIGEEMTGEPL